MASNTREQSPRDSIQPAIALAEMAVRSASQMYDLQMSAIRALSETHVRTATAFGLPDWTAWFASGSEEGLRQAAIGTTEQVLSTSRRTSEAISRLGENLNELLRAQTGAATQQWQKVVEQFGAQATASLERFREITERQSERLMQETEARVEAIATVMQEEGAQHEMNGREAQKTNGSKGRSASREH